MTTLAAAASLAISGVVWAAGIAKSGYLERTETAKNTGAMEMSTVKMYWEGDNFRMEEYSVQGMVVQIKNGRNIYIYNPSLKKAMKQVLPEGAQTVQQLLAGMGGPVNGGKKVGSAKVAGFTCDVYTVAAPGKKAGGSTKIYISTNPQLPIMLKRQTAQGSRSISSDTKVVKLNYNVPDSMFTLPKGTKIETAKTGGPAAPNAQPPAGKN